MFWLAYDVSLTLEVCVCWFDWRDSEIFKNTQKGYLQSPHVMSHLTIFFSYYMCNNLCVFTSGSPNGSNQDRGDGHDQAAEGGQERENLSVGSWRGRKNPLKIDLPGNPPQHLETETSKVNTKSKPTHSVI